MADDHPRLGLLDHRPGEQPVSTGRVCRVERGPFDIRATPDPTQNACPHQLRQIAITVPCGEKLRAQPHRFVIARGQDLIHDTSVMISDESRWARPRACG
jgi:hypothetical protein